MKLSEWRDAIPPDPQWGELEKTGRQRAADLLAEIAGPEDDPVLFWTLTGEARRMVVRLVAALPAGLVDLSVTGDVALDPDIGATTASVDHWQSLGQPTFLVEGMGSDLTATLDVGEMHLMATEPTERAALAALYRSFAVLGDADSEN